MKLTVNDVGAVNFVINMTKDVELYALSPAIKEDKVVEAKCVRVIKVKLSVSNIYRTAVPEILYRNRT